MNGEARTRRHAGVEGIAAFLDGRLHGIEREHVVAHLADCEECYGLFADAARFLTEEEPAADGTTIEGEDEDESHSPSTSTGGRLLSRSSFRWRRPALVGAALAAAAALVLLVGLPVARHLVSSAAPPNIAELTAELTLAAVAPTVESSWDQHGWPAFRGGDAALGDEETLAFQIGVRVVEMEIALAADNSALAALLTQDLETRLEGIDPLLTVYAGEIGIRGLLASGATKAELLSLNHQADGLLAPNEAEDHPGFVDGFWYAMGKWAAAAKLAAASEDGGFFTQRQNRRLLRSAAQRELPAGIAAPVQRLENLVSRQPESHLDEIEHQLDELITMAGGGLTASGS